MMGINLKGKATRIGSGRFVSPFSIGSSLGQCIESVQGATINTGQIGAAFGVHLKGNRSGGIRNRVFGDM